MCEGAFFYLYLWKGLEHDLRKYELFTNLLALGIKTLKTRTIRALFAKSIALRINIG
jgi:hypothetical protein